MNDRDLRIFTKVAELGSISHVAKELNYVQSNISSRIQKLEEDLNVTLFFRSKQGMQLTPEGKVLVDIAYKIIELSDKMMQVAKSGGMPVGKLEIASVETVIKLPLILSKFNKSYAGVDLRLATGVTTELRDKVLNYQLDGAFVTKSRLTSHPELQELDVFEEKLVLIADEKVEDLSELLERPLLSFSDGCGYRAKFHEWLKASGLEATKNMELGTLETTLGSVISGLGIAFVPYSAVAHYEKRGLIYCHELPSAYSEITTTFIYRKDEEISPVLRAFVEVIKETKDDAISPFYRF
ncbi:LysR family transcriptional regulator [Ignatzschineria ureiclastica]|uniref:LysR family transcriptional regulator n=1 Tax=Ignatzschineria ureiclastica TaxID=472582 RepID=A0A2U2ADL8_9GAMM|nr:LysR family transcriptional regulator [Ignatzschineria ureiclastica]PWD80756.1 LysR family transcriptional regulator [Ignatzschineria ureiclastica]GGZ94850.1 HTH-type transcriptional regulator CzcR [Ignatzschineria ureiclastica]